MKSKETKRRLFLRVLTWRVGGILLGVFIGWLFTGSWTIGGGISVTYNLVRVITHYVHEWIWSRCVDWGFLTNIT